MNAGTKNISVYELPLVSCYVCGKKTWSEWIELGNKRYRICKGCSEEVNQDAENQER